MKEDNIIENIEEFVLAQIKDGHKSAVIYLYTEEGALTEEEYNSNIELFYFDNVPTLKIEVMESQKKVLEEEVLIDNYPCFYFFEKEGEDELSFNMSLIDGVTQEDLDRELEEAMELITETDKQEKK